VSDQPDRQLPTAWWRRAARAVDGLDVGFAVSVAMIAAGLFLLWGVAVALVVTGALGLAGAVALLVRSDVAAARSER
jgi:hypothetical protein